MANELVITSPPDIFPADIIPASTGGLIVPAVIADAGEPAAERYIEFLTATIRNAHTRKAYNRAIFDFFTWASRQGLTLQAIKPKHIAVYIELLQRRQEKPLAAPSVKQHLAAIRMCFDFLTTGGSLDVNPASSVRGPKHVVKKGKTPVLTADEARALLDSISIKIGPAPGEGEEDPRPPCLIGLRDRALIAVMCYSFAGQRGPGHEYRGLLPAGQTLVVSPPRERRKTP